MELTSQWLGHDDRFWLYRPYDFLEYLLMMVTLGLAITMVHYTYSTDSYGNKSYYAIPGYNTQRFQAFWSLSRFLFAFIYCCGMYFNPLCRRMVSRTFKPGYKYQ